MGNRKGIIYAALERLDAKMKIGESRFEAKMAQRAEGETGWSLSDGYIHSHGTRKAYQEHVLRFIRWARSNYEVRRLEVLDERAEELATAYLTDRLIQGYSPYTVQAERAALRFFFDQRQLAATVQLPARKREGITRSRSPAIRDKEFQPSNWPSLIRFLQATGLRRNEVRRLLVEDIQESPITGVLEVVIKKGHGKGGRPRRVPVLPGHEDDVQRLREGRDSQEPVFERLPSHLDIHAIRREYAQSYYRFLSGRELPPPAGRLKASDYDVTAVLQVSQALGHNRKDVILRHYIR